jgi:hypothetical protein
MKGMVRPIFQQANVTVDDRVEIPYAPWLLWGQPQVSYVKASRLPADRGEIVYEGWIRLTRNAFGSSVPIDITNPASFEGGDSGIRIPEGYEFAMGIGDEGPAALLKVDDAGYLNHLFFPHIVAPTIEAALLGLERMATHVVWTLTATTHKPMFYDAILVRSADKLEFRASTRAASPDASILELDTIFLHPSLRPIVSLYVEGTRSSSPFYAFLCFFKICERMNYLRGRIVKICGKYGATPPSLNGVFPDDPISHIDTGSVGMKYTTAVDKYQRLYRDAIAHFSPKDSMEPLVNLQAEASVRSASIILRWAVVDLINQIAKMLHDLQDRGVDLRDVTFE